MELKNNVVGWFEIPVANMERAIAFYEHVFGYTLTRKQLQYPEGMVEMAWFPFKNAPGAPGALVHHPSWSEPSLDGSLLYFSSPSGDLTNELIKVEKAGGRILTEKTLVEDEIGFVAIFMDTEGNKIALHSRR